jgi:hypothetical protein
MDYRFYYGSLMKKLAFIASLLMSFQLFATTQLNWEDLRPDVSNIKDPFMALSRDQLFDLGRIARLDMKESHTEEEQQEKRTLTANLESQGLDIEYLFDSRAAVSEQRRIAASTPKQELDGGKFRVPGFITPIQFDDNKITQFFLVPSGGACVHTPPPPPNQIILVDFPEGYKLTSMYQPVWIEGTLSVESSVQEVMYSDGAGGIESTYTMDATKIELYGVN